MAPQKVRVPSVAARAFGVGASILKRRWPFYRELIQLMQQELEFTPLLLAGPGEEFIIRDDAKIPASATNDFLLQPQQAVVRLLR